MKYLRNILIHIIAWFIPSKNLRKKLYSFKKKEFHKRLVSLLEEQNLLLKKQLWFSCLQNKNFTINIKNSKFYLPKFGFDFISNVIVLESQYFEQDILEELDSVLPKNPIIIDAGCNIGNHTLYWANESYAKRIYCFEPLKDTFENLKKNIEINNLSSVCVLHNVALGEDTSKAKVNFLSNENIGGTDILKDHNGNIHIISLDSLDIQEERIDFFKIDVEGFEVHLLKGAINTINKYKPLIFIEAFNNNAHLFLESIGYKKIKDFPHQNYLYKHSSK